jgi:hypothetical protein
MNTAAELDSAHTIARLRPAGGPIVRHAQQPAGPFAVTPDQVKPTARDALVTGLLVLYPAFAAVAAIIAGLFLSGAGGV